MPNAIEQIYDQLMQVFGGTNPNQYFTMLMPGTSLNPSDFAYDTTKSKPLTVARAESLLVDQLFDMTKVTGSSNGQHVSSQFLQALSVLIPKFNPALPVVKNALRDFINSPAPDGALVGDAPFKGTLAQYYFALYERYLRIKGEWETAYIEAEETKSPEQYLEWYEEHAETELAKVDAALGAVTAVIAPTDMDAILGALEAGPGGEIEEAMRIVEDIRVPSPGGGYVYPVNLTPSDWFKDLASDIDPVNLLADPAFIASTITARKRALQASIGQVKALLSQVPSADKLKQDAKELSDAQDAFAAAQANLMNTYTDNTVTAVQMYLASFTGGVDVSTALDDVKDDTQKTAEVKKVNDKVDQVSKANRDAAPDSAAKKKDSSPFSFDDVKKIAAGQKTLVDAQSKLQSTSQKLSQSSLALTADQAATYGNLPLLIDRLQSQLDEIQDLQSKLTASVASAATAAPTPPRPLLKSEEESKVRDVLSTVAKANDVQGIVSAVAATDTSAAVTYAFSSIKTTAENAYPISRLTAEVSKVLTPLPETDPDLPTAKSVKDALNDLTKNNTLELMSAAIKAAGSGGDLKTKVGGIVDTEMKTAKTAMAAAVADAGSKLFGAGSNTSQKSGTSDRFMTMQFSFTNSDMSSSSSSTASTSQTSASVDFFFGSASASTSTSSATSSSHMFDSNTEIQIGLKAAKVAVDREWLNLGIFKLSKSMSRLSSIPVSSGGLVPRTADNTVNLADPKINQANETLLPAVPVAFVIVKDVTFSFKASESSTDAWHSVLDSKSAAGGGFLCFSASHSEATHAESQSVHSKSTGTVFNITIPGPQILGWFSEVTPADNSTVLVEQDEVTGDALNIIQFVNRLKRLTGKQETTAPVKVTA